MIARARITAAGERITGLRSEPPLAFRQTSDALYLVGAAAGPLGGDDLTIDIEVMEGAAVTIRTSAATVVLPGKGLSIVRIRALVAPGAALRWAPEPTVLARHCRHRVETVIDLHGDARLEWWEELVLGRHGEVSGSATTRLALDLDGEPLHRHDLAVGPDHAASATAAVLGASARAVGSVILVRPRLALRPVLIGEGAATLPLDGPGVLVTAVAADPLSLRRSLACGVDAQAESAVVHR